MKRAVIFSVSGHFSFAIVHRRGATEDHEAISKHNIKSTGRCTDFLLTDGSNTLYRTLISGALHKNND